MNETADAQASLSPRVLIVASTTGALSGLICVVLRLVLRFLQWLLTGYSGLVADAASHLPSWRRVATPIFGAIVATLVIKSARWVLATTKPVDYVEAVRFYGGRIPFGPTLCRTLSSCFSIASGAAIGREGSMIQFAAASVAALGRRRSFRKISLDRMVTWGVGAAVASVYDAPVAGVFFALEIVLGVNPGTPAALREIPALAVSGAAGAMMSYFLLAPGPLFAIKASAAFHWHDAPAILLAAVAIGSLGPTYFRVVECATFLKKWPWPIVWSGVVVGLLSLIRPETWGNGDSGILQTVGGQLTIEATLLILLVRLVATAACVGSGVVGGVFTPTVFAGSVLGFLYGSGIHAIWHQTSPVTGYAVLGMACLLASVTHAPFMAAFMTVELTGRWEWLPLTLSCSLISFTVARMISPQSLYAVATPDPGRRARHQNA